jgi:hypothetical protein
LAGPAFHTAIPVNQPDFSVLDRKNTVRANLRASFAACAFLDVKIQRDDIF